MVISTEERNIAHELFGPRMGNQEVQRMIETKEFKYGMKVAKKYIEKNFGKLNVQNSEVKK